MLAKLMKYEIKATARLFLPLYAVLIIYAVINRLINPFYSLEIQGSFTFQTIFGTLSIIVYFILIVSVFVMTLIIIIQRFYKNLLGDEGYLMFTLPVKPWQHIISKLMTAMMWYILSAVFVLLSNFISIKDIDLTTLLNLIKSSIFNASFLILPILILVQLASNTMMIYDAMTLGHLFQKHRLLASFAMYCVLYIIQQVLLLILILPLSRGMFAFIIQSSTPTPGQLNSFFIFLIIPGIIMTATHFAVINYILKRKLNLE